jgi:hypothetical protein
MAGSVSDYFGGVIPGTTGNLDPTSARNPAGSAGVALGTGTGSHGVIPIVSNLGGGVTSAITDFLDWLNTPFKTPMSPGSVGILVGVIIVAILVWNFVLYHVRIAAEAI